ncbi:MAG: 4-hydroxy-tetrahydrodipicolinate reductase [Dehalococcoidia bacterium]|nr:MAG: 4-hydroxy-tetrahydrodipicolinate reductase [Dehalococcoidia bacterium]
MVKIALVGYGKMGQIVENLAREKGHHLTAIIDPYREDCLKEINAANLTGAEVCIDFSHPQVVLDNIKQVAALGKNLVVGTTGWYDQMAEVKRVVAQNNIGLIWSGNFSIGVNALFRIAGCAAKIFNHLPDYDVLAHEVHHKNKADSPSGTASMLGQVLLDNLTRKKRLVFDRLDRKIEPDEIHFSSSRGGAIPGIHTILFDSAVDTIEITHTARSREGFASGAVLAAEFIQGKTGFYNIDDLMNSLRGGE